MINKIHNADCLEFLRNMPDEFVDCIVTSPPYHGLRDYGNEPIVWGGDKDCNHEWGDKITKGEGYNNAGKRWNHGHKREKTPEAWNKQISGGNFCIHCSAWKGNLGLEPTIELYIDNLMEIFGECKRVLKKSGTCWVNIGDSYGGNNSRASNNGRAGYGNEREGVYKKEGVLSKSLCQIPERFSIAMTDRLGWIKRNTIIWYKRNCMPTSASDRFTVDFEPMYFFVKSQEYWFEQQFEPMNYPERIYSENTNNHKTSVLKEQGNRTTGGLHDGRPQYGNPDLGRNKRCVWDIPTESYSEAHFAVFPRRLVSTPIEAGCPPGGVVLDPFAGSGTTCLEAKEQGKDYIGIEINPEYIKISDKRLAQGVLKYG